MIHGRNVEKKKSKWRPPPSRIFEICYSGYITLSSYMTPLPHSRCRINRTIWRWDIAENEFQCRVSSPSLFGKFWFFVTYSFSKLKFPSACQVSTIFKMAAVRHLEFSKVTVLVTWLLPSSKLWISPGTEDYLQFPIGRTIWCWEITKNVFQYDVRPQYWIYCDVIILYFMFLTLR